MMAPDGTETPEHSGGIGRREELPEVAALVPGSSGAFSPHGVDSYERSLAGFHIRRSRGALCAGRSRGFTDERPSS
jgi:hypothetical protein